MTAPPTPIETSTADPAISRNIVRRSLAVGVAGAAVLWGAAMLSGSLPEGTAAFVTAGAIAALVFGQIGIVFKSRAMNAPPGHPKAAIWFQASIAADFLLQLSGVGGTTLALFLADVKFAALVGFALAFAAVALFFQVATSVIIARALGHRQKLAAAGRNTARPKRTEYQDCSS